MKLIIALLLLFPLLSTARTQYFDADKYNFNNLGIITDDELYYLQGATSNIQTQISGKQGTLTNSAGLAGALSDETGTGFSVFSASPALTGNPTATTQTAGDNSTRIATTAYADAAVAGSSVVHTTGNESIAGDKTFTDKIIVSSTTKSSHPCPTMTQAQRDATTPSNGDCVFNSDTAKLNIYNSALTQWKEVSGTGGSNSLLLNSGFEDGTGSWTLTVGTAASEASVKIEGEKSYKVTLSAQTLNLCQSTTTNAAQFNGTVQGLAGAWVKSTIANSIFACSVNAGVTNLSNCAALTTTTDWANLRAPFMLSATSNGICIVSGTLSGSTVTPGNVTGDVYVDDATVERMKDFDTVPVVTLPLAYTPTLTSSGGGAITLNATAKVDPNGVWHREGAFLVGQFSFKNGSGGAATGSAGDIIISIPSGLTIDTAKMATQVGGVDAAGQGVLSAAAYGESSLSVVSNALKIYKASASYAQLSHIAANVISTFKYKVPIVGWSSTVNTYTDQCQTDVGCANEFSASISSAGVVSEENLDWINGNCAISGTSINTCTLTSSIFSGNPHCFVFGATNEVKWNTQSTTTVEFQTFTNGGAAATNAKIMCRRSGTDFKARRQIVGSFKDTPKTIGSSGSDIQSVYFGSSADCSTDCTTGTCTICNQVGSKITSVSYSALALAGFYDVNGIDGTKYNCTGTGFDNAGGSGGLTITHRRDSSTSSYARIDARAGATNKNTSRANVTCIGIP